MDEQLLNASETPAWFNYPKDFLRVVDQGLLDFDPWIILQYEQLRVRLNGLEERYPTRSLVPFARREDNDDVACWEKDRPGVVIIHDFASPGYEDKQAEVNFWDWLRSALETTIEYDGE
ncbi:hypothetical protein [Polycladidibacter stylochi]|uniref:hypothetical protein n=1 Tax=Polycladidibacter stylochi TaxID=1807766 RepID=UPI0008371BCC|nr:hypothetical protein [Pseudovibrio stylochi]